MNPIRVKTTSDRQRVGALAEEVFASPDLVEQIMHGNVGPSTFVAMSRVNRTAHEVCRSSAPLLRTVALYSGALTKAAFCGLFGLSSADAAKLPHTRRGRAHLYGELAVELALTGPDAMRRIQAAQRERAAAVRSQAHRLMIYTAQEAGSCAGFRKRPRWRVEEDCRVCNQGPPRRRGVAPRVFVPGYSPLVLSM